MDISVGISNTYASRYTIVITCYIYYVFNAEAYKYISKVFAATVWGLNSPAIPLISFVIFIIIGLIERFLYIVHNKFLFIILYTLLYV